MVLGDFPDSSDNPLRSEKAFLAESKQNRVWWKNMQYKFVALSFGKIRLPKVDWDPEDLTDLNSRLTGKPTKTVLSSYLNDGWTIKQFQLTKEDDKTVILFLLEK